MVDLLQNLHYSSRALRELPTADIIDGFMQALDPERLIFTQADVEWFGRRFGRTLKNVYVMTGDAQPAYEIYDRFREKLVRRREALLTQLAIPIELGASGPAADAGFARDDALLDEWWLRRLRTSLIRERVAGRSPAEAEAEVRRRVLRWSQTLESQSADEVRERFWESTFRLFDPHSGYFAPGTAAEFDVAMRGVVAGIGVNVKLDEGVCRIAEILADGPAEHDGRLQPGYELLALTSTEGSWVELAGKKIDRIVALLRGPKDTPLSLRYRRSSTGGTEEVTLTRREVVLPENRARGGITVVPAAVGAAGSIGWIELPEFYSDPDGGEAGSARDLEALLKQLVAANVDAVVLDLRRNPGGAMRDAVKIAGLFLSEGTVLATRDGAAKVSETKVPPHLPTYTGPLVVLVSNQTASAGELIAGALQTHRRAVIVGARQSFGKGTAQAYIDLSFGKKDPQNPRGLVRVTAQRFYFPDGRSPQQRGVQADIVLPGFEFPRVKREETLPHSLPGDALSQFAGLQPVADQAAPERIDPLRAIALSRDGDRERKLARRIEELAQEKSPAEQGLALPEAKIWQEQRDEATNALVEAHAAACAEQRFPTQRIDLPSVAEVLRRRQERLRAAAGDQPAPGWVAGQSFCYESGGPLVEIPLSDLPFRRAMRRSPTIAANLAQRAGYRGDAAAVTEALRRLATAEAVDATALRDALEPLATPAELAEALMPAVLREVSALTIPAHPAEVRDLPLREALRVAADWARILKTETVHSR